MAYHKELNILFLGTSKGQLLSYFVENGFDKCYTNEMEITKQARIAQDKEMGDLEGTMIA